MSATTPTVELRTVLRWRCRCGVEFEVLGAHNEAAIRRRADEHLRTCRR
ncbi:MAG: hypothetical protein H6525_08720 [Actinobacteria bacterium]|nr:hypothetical protein [Actinomycetota bacterium]